MPIQALFGKPKIPLPPAAKPTPTKNTVQDAEMAAQGRRRGLAAAMFGYKNPSTTNTGGSKPVTGR